VVGAGIIGSSIAWRLSQAGVQVRLLDAGKVGGEASWASAGMLAPGGELKQRSWWTDLAMESLGLFPAFVEELSAETGISIDYSACGAYEFPAPGEDWAAAMERAKRQQEFGIDCRIEEGRLHYPSDAIVNPRDIMMALHCACLRRDVEVVEHSDAVRFEAGDSPLVIAAGAWSSGLTVFNGGEPVVLPESFPVKGHLLGYDLTPGSLTTILRAGHIYILQRSNGFTVAGSNEEVVGFDRRVDAAVREELQTRAQQLWPELEGRTPSQTWIGFRPGSRSGEPVIGRQAGTNIWLAYGHYRNGILMAPATATRIAGDILQVF
jgi:glycine oxidase